MKHGSKRFLSVLLSLVMVLGLMPGMSLTAQADDGTPLTDGGILSAGTYYLAGNVTLTNKIRVISDSVILNLNGHTLTGNGNDTVISVEGGSLTVNGGTGGTITGGKGETGWENNEYRRGGCISIRGGEVTVNNVTITGNEAHWGGGVIVAGGSTFTMNNSTITGNKSVAYYDWNSGGAVYVQDKSTFIMNGGSITDNTSVNGTFCGVDVNSGTFKVSGKALIYNNKYGDQQKNFSGTVTVDGALTDGANIGVTHAPGVFTSSTDKTLNDASKFTSDNDSYAVGKNADGQLFLGTPVQATYKVENGTWSDDTTDDQIETVASGSVLSSVPTGMKASEGYTGGAWDTNPTDTTITEAKTFTYTFTAKTDVATYSTVSITNAERTIGDGKDPVLTVKGEPDDSKTYDNFTGVEMDGTTVSSDNYTTAKGSLILTLKASYLDTLSAGDHKVTIKFKDGTATATLKQNAATPAPTPTPKPVPKTGDSANPALWLAMMLVALIGFAGLAVTGTMKASRKKK